jgi:hypothetical protein
MEQQRTNPEYGLGVAPDRIYFLLHVAGTRFETAWKKRIQGRYGNAKANWIDLNSLIRIKSHIDNPRHQGDIRVLREVRKRRARSNRKKGKIDLEG